MWRAGFVLSVPFGGLGVIAYLVLWYFMPPSKGDA
jgi:phage shock protein PspC (stress-responsive transcriptional regulator)